MRLGEQQELFAEHFALLLLKALSLGYKFRFEHAKRCHNCPVGKSNSLHKSKLAFDLTLTKDGKILTKTEEYRELGEWWEKQHELASWGGRFNDGNHFSFTRWGIK